MSRRLRDWALLAGALLALAAPAAASAAPPPPAPATKTAAAGDDIRDIHGPLTLPDPWRWLWLAGGALGLAGAGAIAATIVRSRRARPLTADERALMRLQAAEALAAADRPREYAEAASDAVRAYIEERFGLRATHATTDEFLQDLVAQEQSPLGEHRRPLSQFLSACDLAKFACLELPRSGMDALTELARRFVLTTARPGDTDRALPTRTS